jgi:phosphocarrier protein HPr
VSILQRGLYIGPCTDIEVLTTNRMKIPHHAIAFLATLQPVLALYSQEVTIRSPYGLQTRPATQFVKEAKSFESEITVTKEGKTASAKSLYKLQTLGIHNGDVATITASGDDEQVAVKQLAHVLEDLE